MNLNAPTIIIASVILLGSGYMLGSHLSSQDFSSSPTSVASQTGAASQAETAVANQPQTRAGIKPAGVLQGLNDEQITALTSEVLKEPDPLLRLHRWTGVLAEMTKENWRAISKALVDRYASGVDTSEEGSRSQFREGQVLGLEGMEAMPREPNGVPATPTRLKFQGWSSVDPSAALQWLLTLEEGNGKNTLMAEWKKGLAKSTPSVQEQIFPQLQPTDQRLLLNGVINGLVDAGGLPKARQWYEQFAQAGDPLVAKAAFTTLVSRMTHKAMTPETAAFIESEAPKLGNGSEVFRSMCGNVAYYNPGGCLNLLQNLTSTCADVAQNLDSLLAQTVRASSTTSLNTMGNWLNQNPDHPLYDKTLVHFVNQCQADDPEAATRWASSIKDETLRDAALKRLKGQ
jgi:hypothetical protein